MLYTGVVRKNSNVWPMPAEAVNFTNDQPHGQYAKDDRVGIKFESTDKLWSFAVSLDGGPTGWVETKNIVKDPILLVDLFWQDLGGKPKLDVLAATPKYFGCILKATEGLQYPSGAISWFKKNVPLARAAGLKRNGLPWYLGFYHYLTDTLDGAAQADYFMSVVNAAGGYQKGDILPIVDVERGSEKGVNYSASKADVVKNTKAFVSRINQKMKCDVILYGRGQMADLGIVDHMGCKSLWVARYSSKLPATTYTDIGWQLPDVAMWQYTDGDVCLLPNYPKSIPGFGATDTSVFLQGSLADFEAKLTL